VRGCEFRRRLRFVRLIYCQPFWLSSRVAGRSSLDEDKLWCRSLLRGSRGVEDVGWVWKLDVLGARYNLGSLGFVGTRSV
jgi:hypothetical protein